MFIIMKLTLNKMKELIGKSKVSNALPLMQNIATREGLRLNRVKEFNQVRSILESEYKVTRIVW